jgi:MFS family permease
VAADAAPIDASIEDPLPPHYAWNARAITADSALLGFAMSFFSATTVLPSFISTLTGSEVIVGVASGLNTGAWLLPQLAVASIAARLPRKKPLLLTGACVARPLFLFLALATLLFAQSRPTLTLAILLAVITFYNAFDAMTSVAWFDLLARLIPPTRRGRVLGLSQVIGGVGGIGAGLVVRFVLSERSPWAYPANYAVLFVLTATCLMIGAVALSLLREPRSAIADHQVPSLRQVVASLPRILTHDRAFRRLVVVRWMYGFVTVANAFYILYATKHLGLAPDVAGLFIAAQVTGMLMSGLVIGTLQDRYGPLVHMRTMIATSTLPPILALLLGPLAVVLGKAILYPYLLVNLILGLYSSLFGMPFANWILEYVEEARRPLYIGMINTLGAVAMIAPALGGWIARSVSYPAVFGLSILFSITALIVSLRLPNTRHKPR